ncbi:unnamed protein product [Clonostachys byssicola]|uniref:Nucleoporin POM34 n=1 Tax=Clonostachys byssicola TaxID=160290 RepID=A0A9N9UXC2_9HYPO|nr:unnamed protein product [Clonostachys byssicola]
MATTTPVKTRTVLDPSITDSPGTWRHPRLDEITRRRNASTFSDKNIRQIAFSAGGIVAIWLLQAFSKLKLCQNLMPVAFQTYLDWAWLLLQLIPFTNIILACLPLVRKEDDLSDIALTAAQRELLGLPPSSAAPTPDAKFSTPPRYSRTPSIAGSVGSRGSFASSPLSGRGSPAFQGGSGSPYSPIGSPLFKKGLDTSVNGRRSSFGSASPFGANASANLFSDPGSPSPSGGKRTSVGLNNKWLYEKGRKPSVSRLH